MKLLIRMLQHAEDLGQRLRHDGWKLERESDDNLSATHPLVPDALAARQRLCDLGLLTSREIQIRFHIDTVRPDRS